MKSAVLGFAFCLCHAPLLGAIELEENEKVLLVNESGEMVQKIAPSLPLQDPEGLAAVSQEILCVADDDRDELLCFEDQVSLLLFPFSFRNENGFVGISVVNSGTRASSVNSTGLTLDGLTGRVPRSDHLAHGSSA